MRTIFGILSALFLSMLPLFALADNGGELLEYHISRLAWCESRWNERAIVLDTNGKYSRGWLQFQMSTFLGMGKKYGILPEEFTEKEASLLIWNRGVQIAIAREMLQEKNGYLHWKNCSERLGLNAIPHYAFK